MTSLLNRRRVNARKGNYITVLQFNERLISLLRVRRSADGVDVADFRQQRGEWSIGDGTLCAALSEFIDRCGARQDTLYTVLPRHDMTARIMSLPTHVDAEVAGMVRLSADELVPYPADELVIGQSVLQKMADGNARVLAVFAHRDIVATHLDALRSAGLEPEQIFMSTACLGSAVQAARRGASERYAVVNFAAGGMELLVFCGRRLEYARGVAVSQDWSLERDLGARPQLMDELEGEVRASLAAYQRESPGSEPIWALYACSDWADAAELCELLRSRGSTDCSLAAFSEGLVVGARPAAPIPLVLLGGALAAQGRATITIDLVPESVRNGRRRTMAKRAAVRAAAWAVAFTMSLGLLYGQAIYQRRGYIRELIAMVSKLEPDTEEIAEKERRLAMLRDLLDRSGSDLELLAAVCELMPAEGINITRFTFKRGEGIVLDGRATDVLVVAALTQSLLEAGKGSQVQFAQARRQVERQVDENGRPVVEYSIRIPFHSQNPEQPAGELP